MDDFYFVLTTVGSEEQAISIAEELVDKNLSACVNIIPGVRSIYRWKGEICNDEELYLVIKTSGENLDRIHSAIRELHNYELPECIALKIDQGCPDYLKWIGENLISATDERSDKAEDQTD